MNRFIDELTRTETRIEQHLVIGAECTGRGPRIEVVSLTPDRMAGLRIGNRDNGICYFTPGAARDVAEFLNTVANCLEGK